MPEQPATWKVRRNDRTETITDESVINAMPAWELACRTAVAAEPYWKVDGTILRNLLDAYDATLAEVATHEEVLERANRSITSLEARSQRAEAHAAAAEAAVQHIDEMCTQWDTWVAAQVHAYIASLPAASSAVLTEPDDACSVSAALNRDDEEPVTIHGYVHWVEYRANRSGAPYLEVRLLDLDADEDTDPDPIAVHIPPAAYAAMVSAMLPQAGTLLRVEGRTRRRLEVIATDVRQPFGWLENGEPVYDLTDQPLPERSELDAPPFTPRAVSQFRAGFEQARRDIEAGEPR